MSSISNRNYTFDTTGWTQITTTTTNPFSIRNFDVDGVGDQKLHSLHPGLAEYFNYVQKGMACDMCGGVVTSKDCAALTLHCIRAVDVGTGVRMYAHGAWEICKYLMNTVPKTPKGPEPTDWGEYGL